MKFSFHSIQIFAFAGLALFTSCKKDDKKDPVTPAATHGKLVLEFDNVVGEAQLALDSTGNTYTNASGEKFSVTQFNYYISNISLTKTDGSVYTVPQDSSYFLVMESRSETQEVLLPHVPVGDYNSVSFTIGVDSLRSTKGLTERTGVLAPDYLAGHGMYWSWNSGYIFLKLEGVSASAPVSSGNFFYYHIGGFGGYSSTTINNIRNMKLTFPEAATVRGDIKPDVHMMVDVKKVFDGTSPLKISEDPEVMFSPRSVGISANYASMMKVHHVHNDH
jgi:hypothetical protein